ncbi:efflux RND transporter periplasmic adaptor subunit [Clostridium kluyveri]|uniref:Efflux transporter periplasmic adaptor subunit n=1 Tax=Clostridium kluyveri TaxID=1534 RepID=A0A1L5FD64_CLOKL|nr:HlyD family efflux transporter periplasmic adaptor subunit [Clostridium kluyveri]APM40956.1 efflux transporter periplasmic adaptor subunit [Clostridium kluyveri]UZQ48766.1 HlyD family efflux transporter periplasmic adaptor subunit [Clostridium kluyveri]
MKDRKKILIIGSAVGVIIILFVVTLFLNYNKRNAHKNDSLFDIYTIPAQQNIFLDGEVQYSRKLNFTEDATKGTVDKINVEDKEQVGEGQTLFTYKNDQMIEQYDTLTQQLNSIETQAKSMANVQNSTQISEINSQKTSLKQQLNNIKDKRYTTISAPFDGIVSMISDNEDSTNKIILTLIDPKMQVVASVSEKDVLKLKESQKIKITVYGTNEEFKGTISSISTEPSQAQAIQGAPASNLTQATGSSLSYYPVYIDIDNHQGIYAGFHIQGTAVDESELPKIPVSSVFNDNGHKSVWLVKNKKLRKVRVRVEKYNNTYVQVKSGLDFNDKIMKNPSSEMKEGDSIDKASSGS